MEKIYDDLWYYQRGCRSRIAGRWRRKDTLDECAASLEKFLREFIEMFPCFPPFSWSVWGAKDSLVPLSHEEIKQIICKCYDPKYTEDCGSDIVFSNTGNHVSNTNFKKYIIIDLHIGCYGGRFNSASITLPPKNDEMGELISEQSFNKVFDLILRCWNPSSGGIYPSLPDIDLQSSVGWMTYFSKEFGQLPTLPNWTKVTEKEQGYCIQALEKLPDEENESAYIKRMKKLDKVLGLFSDENWQRVEADRMR
jgi:hypothetical protein